MFNFVASSFRYYRYVCPRVPRQCRRKAVMPHGSIPLELSVASLAFVIKYA